VSNPFSPSSPQLRHPSLQTPFLSSHFSPTGLQEQWGSLHHQSFRRDSRHPRVSAPNYESPPQLRISAPTTSLHPLPRVSTPNFKSPPPTTSLRPHRSLSPPVASSLPWRTSNPLVMTPLPFSFRTIFRNKPTVSSYRYWRGLYEWIDNNHITNCEKKHSVTCMQWKTSRMRAEQKCADSAPLIVQFKLIKNYLHKIRSLALSCPLLFWVLFYACLSHIGLGIHHLWVPHLSCYWSSLACIWLISKSVNTPFW